MDQQIWVYASPVWVTCIPTACHRVMHAAHARSQWPVEVQPGVEPADPGLLGLFAEQAQAPAEVLLSASDQVSCSRKRRQL